VRSKTPLQADKILAAAARLFATHRFHEARMEDIAALAEVGKGTLYRYFKDKDELYLALLGQAADGLSQQLEEELGHAEGPRARLEAIVRALIGYFDEHPHLFDLIAHAEVMHKPDSEFPWQKARDLTQSLVKGAFAEAEQAGEFVVGDPDLALWMLLGGTRAVLRFGDQPRAAGLARHIVDACLSGVARPLGQDSVVRKLLRCEAEGPGVDVEVRSVGRSRPRPERGRGGSRQAGRRLR
jgi:AcrR family transcriptional regulator